ncbi:hypothetical protein KM792_06175 [Clostridium tyrobutyricum]|uniref:tetratricopeptide repeat protein n=1 Tax=Clostridium tyrobutyricum TaxID=1519 RepID=UPI001C381D34|nr:hypothetical protein [Clostridium tyrobutyricum]MBV4449257.1 hypothetical protein [Clostridium tyrobutyricum]
MEIDKVAANKIVTFFNEAVCSYNKIVELRKASQQTLVEDFNSNLQYYSAIESAFREVIIQTLGKECPHNLHEMIEILVDDLSPCPLETGIDLFYILRYKDTRNQAVHNLNIKEINAYPRLFLSGKRFIKQYVKPDAQFEDWKIETKTFDYADFNQIFKTSLYDNIRILILPPYHDCSKEQLEVLKRYHWNVVLDFDPYSSLNGVFSKLQSDKTRLVQLSETENYTDDDFMVEDTVWVMCDGDKQMGVKSFKPSNKQNSSGEYIPAMLEGDQNWTECYNIEKSFFSTKKLLNKFFKKYFSRMEYNTEIVFLMDYAKRVNEAIYGSISYNLNTLSYGINMFFLNESLSEQLYVDVKDYINSNILDTSLQSFLDKVASNVNTTKVAEDDRFLLPCNAPCNGVLSRKSYYHISQQFNVLHSNFPLKEDNESADPICLGKYLFNFSRGEEASWLLIKKKMVAQFDIFDTVYHKVEKAVSNGKRFFNIYHVAGFGGSTIAKHIAFKLHNTYPVLFMKKYDKNDLGKRIIQIYNLTHKRIVIFVEDILFDNALNDRSECIRIAEATSAQVIFIFIGRKPQSYRSSEKDSIFICKYGLEDIDRLIDFNLKVLGTEEATKRKLLNESAETYLEKLDEENICPFLVNLSIYKDEFIKIDDYVQPFVSQILKRPQLKKIFVYSCIFSRYINKGIPIQFVSKQLSLADVKLVDNVCDEYDALLYKKHNSEFFITELSIRAPFLADCLLRKLIGNNEEGIVFREELNNYLKKLIIDIKNFYANSQYAGKCLRQLFIDKSSIASDYSEAMEVVVSQDLNVLFKYFAPIIAKLWDKNNINLAGEIYEELIKAYPNDSYFYAHAARFYAYTGKDFNQARKYYNTAIEKIKGHNQEFAKADIYHVKGMCLREELFKNIKMLPKEEDLKQHIDYTVIKKLAKEAEATFEMTRQIALGSNSKTVEYACTAWLTLIVKLLDKLRKYDVFSTSEIEEYVGTGQDLISDLEEIYILSEKENNYDYDDQLDDLVRKKEFINSFQKDFSTAIGRWNNFYVNENVKGNHKNCVYACKNRYYLLERDTNNFTFISRDNQKRINVLAENYYDSLIHLKEKELRIGDLQTYLAVARLAHENVSRAMSLISNLYLEKRDKVDPRIILYRYILKFLQAYNGEKLSLQECSSCITDCKNYTEKMPGSTNSLEFYCEGVGMGQLVSKRWIINVHSDLRVQIYKAKELGLLRGILKQTGNETTIIPYDKNENLMSGIEVHANLKYNPNVEASDSGVKVKFKVGFSYDGLKAENMSIDYDNDKININKDVNKLEIGDYTAFIFTRVLSNRKTQKKYALIGKVGMNEDCILHIKQVDDKFVSQNDFEKLGNFCSTKSIKVQLIKSTERGWEVSLKSQKIDFNNLSSIQA